MNITLNYVIASRIKLLLMAPAYLRWSFLLTLAVAISFILINQFIIGVRDSSEQLDTQFRIIDDQLARYEQHRDRINHDFEKLIASSRLVARLEKEFSQTISADVESWLVDAAINNDLETSQIRINSRLIDKQGEFFRLVFKLQGSHQNIKSFLEKIIRSDYFLIWEKLSFDVPGPNQLSLTVSLKQYVGINDENSVSN